jgi:hypothetical protein
MLTRPSHLLKLEDALLAIAAFIMYAHLHLSWLLFSILFLTPDLSMLGYLVGPRIGSATYNFAHTYTIPLLLLGMAYYRGISALTAIALIWISHIAIDRLLGYGLKYPTHFKDTHLQHIG